MQSDAGSPKTQENVHMPDFCLSGCPSSWLYAYTLPKNPDPKLLKRLSTAFKAWPLKQLYLAGVCVRERERKIYNFLYSCKAQLFIEFTWWWWEFAHRCQWTQTTTTRAPPATNYRNWNWSLARREPAHLCWPIKSPCSSRFVKTWFLKPSENAVHGNVIRQWMLWGWSLAPTL